jgi:hypothetical protein
MAGSTALTYELYVDDARYAVPTLHFITAMTEAHAREVAERILRESNHHLGAEVRLEGQRLLGLGSFATRRHPPESAGRDA